VAKEAVVGIGPLRTWQGPDVVGALVVRDRTGRTRKVVGPFSVRQRDGAGAQTDNQGDRNACAPNPR
jgi:hypothetical protein